MVDFLTQPHILPFIIFFLRVANNAIGTVRLVAMNREQHAAGFALASLESLMFAYTAGIVLTNLENAPNLAAYVLGFAVGGYVGLWIERRYLNAYHIVDIVTPVDEARVIASQLRDAGYGVTEMPGVGARGQVCQLRIVAHHADVRECIQIARSIRPNAFITVEESRYIQNGWIRSQQQHTA